MRWSKFYTFRCFRVHHGGAGAAGRGAWQSGAAQADAQSGFITAKSQSQIVNSCALSIRRSK
jgi:hypothetical protein